MERSFLLALLPAWLCILFMYSEISDKLTCHHYPHTNAKVNPTIAEYRFLGRASS